MGGRGGLNILPQKKWNVYNWDNRIKVKQNEEIVNKEIERRKLKHRQKRLNDKMTQIKNKSPQSHFSRTHSPLSNNISDSEKNAIFKEIMQRKSIINRINHDSNFANNNKLVSMNESINYETIKTQEEINCDLHEKASTLIETLQKNLKPWYMQKKADDYKEYQEYKMLSNKREREAKTEKKQQQVLIEDLRQKRKKRESKEHERIIALLSKNNKK